MLRALLIAAILLLATWTLLVVAAKRLPPGLLKDLAGFLPACLTTVRRLRNDPRVPRRAKVAILLAGLWLLSPIDLLPEFLPVIGPLDDVLVVALALRYAARSVPRPVLLEAWPADPRLLERLLGPPTPAQAGCSTTVRSDGALRGPLGGVVRSRRAVRFARLIHRPYPRSGGPAVRAAFGGSLSLPWLPLTRPALWSDDPSCGRRSLLRG